MGMCICNDRRWPETYRVMGLQGVEMIMLGYNTPFDHTGHRRHRRPDQRSTTTFRCRPAPIRTATWVIGTAKCGIEEGSIMIGQSAIIAPSGEIVAQAVTLEDEVITAAATSTSASAIARRSSTSPATASRSHYRLIVERKGAIPPPEA